MLESFPNDYGLCECDNLACRDVFELCETFFSLQLNLFDGGVLPAGANGPSLVAVPNFVVYSFNGANSIADNWVEFSDTTNTNFLSVTDDFTISFWLLVETNSDSTYLLSCDLERNRYFSMYESSRSRLTLYYFRDSIPGFPNDDGYNTQVALSFYYDTTAFPDGLRDSKWHFISLTVDFPTVYFSLDGHIMHPTQGNYVNEFGSRILLDRDGSMHDMPAPILTKTETQMNEIECKLGGSNRGTSFALFGMMRQPTVTNILTETDHRCIASCNEYLEVDSSFSVSPSFEIFYDPVQRQIEFSSQSDVSEYSLLLQSLTFNSNGFIPPEEEEESRQINIQITDEVGVGNTALVTITGRSNQFDPILDVNGDQVSGIDFSITFREGEDIEVPVTADQAFFTDSDIDSRIHTVVIRLTNRQFPSSIERLTVSGTTSNAVVIDGSGTSTITISAIDPFTVTQNNFLTTLVNIRYFNIAREPLAIDRLIEFTVSDGQRTNNPLTRTTINILTVNDPPVVDLNGGSVGGVNGSESYTEESPPKLIAADLSIINDEVGQQIIEAVARIRVVFDEGFESISVDASQASNSGISCSPSSCSGTEITLNGASSISNYQGLLRTLRYVNLLNATNLPNLRDREIFVSVIDFGGATSDPTVRILLDFLPVNPRVLIELDTPKQNYTVFFTEAQEDPISCVNIVRFIDSSIVTLESVVVSIRPNLPPGVVEDREMILLTSTAGLTISIEINTALKRITFSQTASVDEYVQAISRVLYVNNEDEPFPINRFVDFLVIPGGGAPNGTALTNITIININDISPVCDPSNIDISISESTASNSVIYVLRSTDGDIGIDGDIFYTIINGDPLFGITTAPDGLEQNGNLTLLGSLDREENDTYFIEVQVCDLGEPQLCCSFNISIEVTDINDLPPVFEQPNYSVNVSENVAEDLFTFTINDGDLGSNAEIADLQIDSSSYNPRAGCMGNFQARVVSGVAILATTGLDFEMTSICRFTVVATDGGSPALEGVANITVTVLNVDDFPPVFSLDRYEFLVSEDNPFPLLIGRVQATDVDSNDNDLIFTLAAILIDQFSVDPATGNVSILFQSNITVTNEYTFSVIAEDPAGNNDIAEVVVIIVDINNRQPILDLNITDTSFNLITPVTFVEEGPSVVIPTNPQVTDPDDVPLTITIIEVSVVNSASITNEVLGVNADPSLYTSEDTSSGTLRIRPANETDGNLWLLLLQSITYQNTEDEISPCRSDLYQCREGALSRTLVFTVNDGMFNSIAREAYIVFEVVNDAPVIDLDSLSAGLDFTTEFREGQSAISIVNSLFVISDDDNDNLQSLTCTLTNPLDGMNEFLLIDTLSFPNSLNFTLSPNRYEIQIFGDAVIGDYRDAVALLQYNSTTRNPNTTVERMVQWTVSDGLLNSEVATTFIFFNTSNQIPELDLDSISPDVNFVVTFVEEGGPVILSREPTLMDIDDESIQELELTLMDASGPQEVLNVTEFLPSGVTFNYVYPTLRVVGIASIDIYTDIISSITYNNLDSEIASNNTRIVEFNVTDRNGGISAAVYTDIRIQPVDDNAPSFTSDEYIFEVEENSARSTLVGIVEISDLDMPAGRDVPVFTFTTASPLFGTSDFRIINDPSDLYQGRILVNFDLDFDGRVTTYILTLQASSGDFTDQVTVTINIINLPDIDPVFTNCSLQFSVFENEVLSTPLMPSSCQAVDPDNLDVIMYSILGNVIGGLRLVNINPTTGVIFVDNNINREIVGVQFTVTISATDTAGSVNQTSMVIIMGENEFPPTFDQPSYSSIVFENQQPSLVPIVTVSATDADEVPDLTFIAGFVSRITYSLSIVETTPTPFFSINSTTGAIFQEEVLDFETIPQFTLEVTASDNDATDVPMDRLVIVTVVVRNINDELPFFVNFSDTIEIPESPPIENFHTVRFGDPDIDSSLQLVLLPAGQEFLLNSASGQLSSVVELDADIEPRVYTYNVTLTDLSTNQAYDGARSVIESLAIVVVDVNDNTPRLTQPLFEGSVTENEPAGSVILQVFATDADYGLDPAGQSNGNNILRFSLLGAPPNIFAIDELTGLLSKRQALDREEQAVYEFTVIVVDSPSQGLALSNGAMVRITVLDENEFPPRVDPSQYFISVLENISVPSLLETTARVSWNYQSKCDLCNCCQHVLYVACTLIQ